MQPGSNGPHIAVLQSFLAGYVIISAAKEGFVINGVYDAATVLMVQEYQKVNGLEEDGGFGPDTRKKAAEEDKFDLEKVFRLIPGISVFVQLDGAEVKWSPDEGALAAANEPRLAAPYDE